MSITISPLDLELDTLNPRFVILAKREQTDIRKYLITNEDVCQLAGDINNYGSLLPGERIVVLQENAKYVVIEGNRRTCSLQLLLSRDLIPDGFSHRIPHASSDLIKNCSQIEVDILNDRDEALELMTKRHIEGVKQWKPLAKKQFFASNYNNGNGQTVENLSRVTGIREREIKEDIREYKLFLSAYEKYCSTHPDYNKDIISLKTDPFWRIFKAKIKFPVGTLISPKDLFQLTYDDTFNTVSNVSQNLFEQIIQLVFEKTIVEECITTRNVLLDIEEVHSLLVQFFDKNDSTDIDDEPNEGIDIQLPTNTGKEQSPPISDFSNGIGAGNNKNGPKDDEPSLGGGPRPGGLPPATFFESLSWHDKIDPAEKDHQGLLCVINELYLFSIRNCDRNKAYRVFPIAAGMVLRTAYEQVLVLRLKQVDLWSKYQASRNDKFQSLKSIEDFINSGANKSKVFSEKDLLTAYEHVIKVQNRDFLNANVHNPGNIKVTSHSLEGIAAGGMYSLVQGIINSL